MAGILGYQLYDSNDYTTPVCDNGVEWVPFNQDELKKYVAKGKIVFVDITAQWCVTCYVNKAVALSDARVLKIFNHKDVISMRGDWTQSNESIARYLSKQGRYGIPFNAIYSRQYPKGLLLSEILTPRDVLAAFKKVGH